MQFLRILWARKWLVFSLSVLVAVAGIVFVLTMPKRYTADASLVVDVRIDPVLGAIAPGLASPAFMATQVEILKSDRVASRVVKMLGVERSPAAIQQWRESTEARVPLERYFANLLQTGLSVAPSRGSNVINVGFASADPVFASAAANAFAQAYMDVSVELRIEPTRQSQTFLDEQTKVLRANLEQAQARLSKFQQDKGIVVSDERVDQEMARLNQINADLAAAQVEQIETSTRQRNSGGEMSPDVMQSGLVQSLKAQIAGAQTKLSEISSIVGVNHPQRKQLEAQVAELRRQLSAEMRRVSGGTSVVSRGSAQKVEELKALAELQKRRVLALRNERDQIAVYQRDVEAAQRAYDAVSRSANQVGLESQNTQASVRLLSPAVEPMFPSKPRVAVGILGSIAGGLLVAALVALGLELLDRRVRNPEDLMLVAGVPVIGVLRPADSRRPVFRRLTSGGPPGGRPALAAPGAFR
jgi:chain length determinant protein EpsF